MQPANRMLQPAELKSDRKLMWSPGRGTDVWALIRACASGDLEAVRQLIAEDPSLARSHYDYRKPLYSAVRENRIDVVRFLLEHDRNPLDLWVDDDPIEIARDRGYTEIEQLLTDTLDTKFNASPKGEPVALALREHGLKQTRELLDAQPELVGKGDTRSSQPIHWATMTRQVDGIDELLRRGAPKSLPDDQSWATPLAWAIRRGHDKIARLLS
jgi:ankyrin repeat protein